MVHETDVVVPGVEGGGYLAAFHLAKAGRRAVMADPIGKMTQGRIGRSEPLLVGGKLRLVRNTNRKRRVRLIIAAGLADTQAGLVGSMTQCGTVHAASTGI